MITASVTEPPEESLVESGKSVSDSHEIGLDQYLNLPLDTGSVVDLGRSLNAATNQLFWDAHHKAFDTLIWLINLLFSFEWVDPIQSSMGAITTASNAFVGDLRGVVIVFALACAGLVYGIAILFGRAAHGFMNIAVSVVIAAVMTTVLLNPWTKIHGPDGWFESFKTGGAQVAAVMISDDGNPVGADEITSDTALTGSMAETYIDVLIRDPYQMLLFGKTITGECVEVLDETLSNVTPGERDDMSVREKVSDCDEEAKFYAENSSSQIDVMAGAGVLLFSFFVVTGMILAVMVWGFLGLCWRALTLSYQGIIAIFPGADRSGFFDALGKILVDLILVAGSFTIMAIHLKATELFLKALAIFGEYKYAVVAFLALFTIVVVIYFRKWLAARARGLAGRLQQSLGSKGSAGTSGPSTIRQAVSNARGMANSAVHAASSWSNRRTMREATAPRQTDQPASGTPSRSQQQSPSPAPGGVREAAAQWSKGHTTGRKIMGKAAKTIALKAPGVGPVVAGAAVVADKARKGKKGVDQVRQTFSTEGRSNRKVSQLRHRLDDVQARESARQDRSRAKIDKVEDQKVAAEHLGNPDSLRTHRTYGRLESRAQRLHQRLDPSPRRTQKHQRLTEKLKSAENTQAMHQLLKSEQSAKKTERERATKNGRATTTGSFVPVAPQASPVSHSRTRKRD